MTRHIQGWPANENIWIYSTNAAIVLILLNIQIAMSSDRVMAIRFPFIYARYKDSSYRNWITIFCVILGSALGSIYGIMELMNGTDVNSFSPHVDLKYKTFAAIYSAVAIVLILALNVTVIYSAVFGVSSIIDESTG